MRGYEYRSLTADTWDLFRGDTSRWPDRFFYKDVIARFGQPVLDVGCGTGRLLLDFLAGGIDVDGIDNSPEMLARCRQKGEAAGLQVRAYEQLFAHLIPGGGLVLPFMIEWQAGAPLEQEWPVRERVRPEDGAVVRRRSLVRYEPGEQLEHTEDIYEVIRDGSVVASEHHRRSPAVRWYTQEQAEAVCRQAGFVEITRYHEFSFEPARPDDALFTIIGRRP